MKYQVLIVRTFLKLSADIRCVFENIKRCIMKKIFNRYAELKRILLLTSVFPILRKKKETYYKKEPSDSVQERG